MYDVAYTFESSVVGENLQMNEAVYFLQAENGLIKIGKSTGEGVERRIRAIITMSAVPVHCVGWTTKYTEAELHKRFKEFRMRGEWFFPHISLIQFIQTELELRQPESIDEPEEITPDQIEPLTIARDKFVGDYLHKLMKACGGKVLKASKVSGRYRADLYELLRRHNIKARDYKDKSYNPDS